jgi:3-oxoacyl-(acyl-carrier-protein) synthase
MVNQIVKIAATAFGANSILAKGISGHRDFLFSASPKSPQFASAPLCAGPIQHSQVMIPIENELLHYGKLLGFPLSRNSALILAAFEECLLQSGWTLSELAAKRVAFIMGTTAGCSSTDANYAHSFCLDESPNPEAYNNGINQNPAGVLKKFCGLRDASVFLINNACTSSTDALGLGAKFLEQNKFDIVFAGGSDEVPFQASSGFGALQLVSPKNRCAPFDLNRDGLLLSEGASVVCLERTNERPMQNILGFVRGYESVAESFHQTGPHPDAEGLQSITTEVLKKNSISVSDIQFISAHGTGTPSNDLSEGKFYSRYLPGIPVLGTKGYTGHCLGAVGTLEAIFSWIALAEKKLPISFGFSELDPKISLRPTTEVTALRNGPLLALSSSIGFGGVNSILLLEGNS